MSFTGQILAGLGLGVTLGIFVGELAAPLTTTGNVYIGLLQMTVLPYIVVSLVANLGRIVFVCCTSCRLAIISQRHYEGVIHGVDRRGSVQWARR